MKPRPHVPHPELALVEPTPRKEVDPAVLFARDPSVAGDEFH